MKLESLVRKAVKVDTILYSTRGKFYRVCVEIDFLKHLVPFFIVMGTLQPIEYEELYQIYFRCVKYGHKKNFAQFKLLSVMQMLWQEHLAELTLEEEPLVGK